jgi:hypothetical protein
MFCISNEIPNLKWRLLNGDIYDVLSDGVAGENIVYHNGTANVFSNMERIYHLQTLQIQKC